MAGQGKGDAGTDRRAAFPFLLFFFFFFLLFVCFGVFFLRVVLFWLFFFLFGLQQYLARYFTSRGQQKAAL